MPRRLRVYPASRHVPAEPPDLADRKVRERLSPAALKAFFNIMQRWQVRDEDARALLENPQAIQAVSPEMQRRLQVEYGASNGNLPIYGVWPSYFGIQNHNLVAGRLFTESE